MASTQENQQNQQQPCDFAARVWREAQRLKPYARKLWRNPADMEDGISETVLRAISKRRLFDGSNMAAWLTTIMRNLRRDQASKGYAKGTKGADPRMVYVGGYDCAAHLPTLDTPEAILIAVGSVRRRGRSRGKYGASYVWTFDDGREVVSR